MTLSDIPEERKAQLTAIEIELATARDYIRDDLKAKFGHGENKFFDLDLVEYRVNNNLLDIAKDLDVKSRYGIKKNEVAQGSVGCAFRGHHNEDFKPEYQFNGLFSEEMNDMIEESRDSINGRIGGRASVETHGDQMRNGGLASVETHGDQLMNGGLARALAQGQHVWSLEEIAEIGELKYEQGLTWNDTTSRMNEKYGEDYTTGQVKMAYYQNKDKLPDEEE